jgi:GTP-binding protein
MKPSVVIVGRPNVGKSTLFNRLVGKKLALVDDRPGVTRDRREGEGSLGPLEFMIMDTAGLEEAPTGSLSDRMRGQTESAITSADVILFMIDARAGLLPDDRAFAEVARRSGKPVILLANKAEGKAGQNGVWEAFQLGLGEPIPISAEHDEGMSDLYHALEPHIDLLSGYDAEPEEDEDDFSTEETEEQALAREAKRLAKPLRIAVVGRPNAGKSTLINHLIGEERLLTGPEAGITRDSISVKWQYKGRDLMLFDTAGMRKRARIEDKLEKLAVSDGLRAVRFAEVVIVLLDATIPFEKQDLTIVDLIEREGRALVIALNKWDLVADQKGLLTTLREEALRLLPQVKGVAVVPVSGLAGSGVPSLMQAVMDAEKIWNTRISTSKLNDWFQEAVQAHTPPAVSGFRIKLRYATQVKSRPPHFAIFGNQLNALPQSYVRYLVNSLRETFGLKGTPIRTSLRTGKNPYDKNK